MNFQPVIDSVSKIILDIADFIPLFANALLILILGYLISWLVRVIVRWTLTRLDLDARAERGGVNRVVKDLRVNLSLSKLIAQLVFYFLFISFATEAMRILHFDSIAQLLSNLLQFIPRVISAAVVLILGALLARFLGNTVSTLAGDVNITYNNMLGKVLEYTIVAFTLILAVSTLGVDTTILTTSLTIIIAAGGLAVALTFSLGSRDSARNIIAGYSVQQRLQVGQEISFEDYEGTVSSTSGAYTTLRLKGENGQEKDELVLPNTLLVQKIIRLHRSGSTSLVEPEQPQVDQERSIPPGLDADSPTPSLGDEIDESSPA